MTQTHSSNPHQLHFCHSAPPTLYICWNAPGRRGSLWSTTH